MFKKILVLFAIVSLSANAFAVPSVKKLGKNTGLSVAKPVVTEKNTSSSNVQSKAVTAKVATTPTIKATANPDQTRFPAITVGKSFKTVKTPTLTPNVPSTNQPVNTGVSEQELDAITQRVEALESQNVINDVSESGSGNYVTDVSVNGNKLNVTKTHLLYAPVRNANSDTITGDAEIWIVK